MGKITDEDGGFLEDEDGHGIYDLAGITESVAGADTPTGELTRKRRAKRELTSNNI